MTDTTTRNADLKQMLSKRRHEMQDDVQSRMRVGRAERTNDVCDNLEHSDADSQGDIGFMLIQMRAETLIRIDDALVRLAAGQYGSCVECDDEISERRLRALPFAECCQACEERREQRAGRMRHGVPRRLSLPLFSEAVAPTSY
jgi:DnaK suppressor protein